MLTASSSARWSSLGERHQRGGQGTTCTDLHQHGVQHGLCRHDAHGHQVDPQHHVLQAHEQRATIRLESAISEADTSRFINEVSTQTAPDCSASSCSMVCPLPSSTRSPMAVRGRSGHHYVLHDNCVVNKKALKATASSKRARCASWTTSSSLRCACTSTT